MCPLSIYYESDLSRDLMLWSRNVDNGHDFFSIEISYSVYILIFSCFFGGWGWS